MLYGLQPSGKEIGIEQSSYPNGDDPVPSEAIRFID